ncbi:MAG: hypothetical protein LAT68_13750 [Cyclobacteriaceae bacterium]|nr:hypothetical protein [Cyclobacteriaceae bacterium]MCH8517384.1 hypothetical protein [Cyclobacteriaceae bacterium]
MKKNLFVFVLLILAVLGVQAQEKSEKATKESQQQESELFTLNRTLFAMGSRYGDATITRLALYNLLAYDPSNEQILDTLANLYFDEQKYTNAILVARDLLQVNPNSEAGLEISAISYESIGLKRKSLEFYESLYLKTDNLYALYKIAFMQTELERYNEALASIEGILDRKKADNLKVSFNDEEGNLLEIPMKAVMQNLKGEVFLRQDNKAGAKEAFENAIIISPEFKTAKDNLNKLK